MTRRGWVAFAAMSIIWGTPYLLIRIAVRNGIPPVFLAWARVSIAAVILLVVAGRAGRLGTLRGRWRWLLAFTLAEVVIPLPAIGFGERRVASSLAAILVASVPLIVAGLALRFDHEERPTLSRAFGLCVGFLGVVALVGLDVASSGRQLVGALAILLAALGYAAGPMLLKRKLGDLDASAVMAGSMSLAALVLAVPAWLDPPGHVPAAGPLAAIAALGVVCTAVAFVGYAILIVEAGPARASVITYINPVVALLLGVALLGEHPGAGAFLGLVLILAGSWFSTRAG